MRVKSDTMKNEQTLYEEKIELKYVNRLCDNGNLGFRYCKIDKEDLEVVRKIFTSSLGYYISTDGKYLNWE